MMQCSHYYYVVLMDLKKLMIHWGHLPGDAVLVKVAERVESAIRKEGFLARVGGMNLLLLLIQLL